MLNLLLHSLLPSFLLKTGYARITSLKLFIKLMHSDQVILSVIGQLNYLIDLEHQNQPPLELFQEPRQYMEEREGYASAFLVFLVTCRL